MERTDNRKPQLFIEISFIFLVIAAMAINVYNIKKVVYLYTVLVIMGIAVVFYVIIEPLTSNHIFSYNLFCHS